MQAARESPRALANYLRGLDRGRQIIVMEGPPSIRGRIFYREDMSGFNFERKAGAIGATIERLLAQADDPNPPTIFIESAQTENCLPAFAAAHPMPLVAPRIRAAHLDRQLRRRAHALRSVREHRLRRRWPAALHAVSARTGLEPLSGSRRFHALGRADEHGARCSNPISRSSRVSPTRCAMRKARNSNPAMAVHPVWLVASRPVADAVQRARELLVEHRAEDGQPVRRVAACGADAARHAGRSARGVARAVRSLRLHGSGGVRWAPDARAARVCSARLRAERTRQIRAILAAAFSKP